VQIYLSRGGGAALPERPDAVIRLRVTNDSLEGSYRLALLPPEAGRPPLLVVAGDQLDSPNLSQMGGVVSGVNSGGALLFDVSAVPAVGSAVAKPMTLTRDHAFARFYGYAAFTNAGRSVALADVDGTPGVELLLGAPYASSPGLAADDKPLRYSGEVLAYSLSGLTEGAAYNKPLDVLRGTGWAHALGVGLEPWNHGGKVGLAAVSGRATTAHGEFVGRLETFIPRTGEGLSSWASSSAAWPAAAGGEQFGARVAASSAGPGPTVLIGAPGRSGPGLNNDGDDVAAGAVFEHLLGQPGVSVLVEGALAPRIRGGRSLGTSLSFGDFDGDRLPDVVVGAPGLQIPGLGTAATDIEPHFVANPACTPAKTASVTGGVMVLHGNADGTFTDAFRLWAPQDLLGCTPAGSAVCRRQQLGREVVSGFDFNGDAKDDLLAARVAGVELWLGRAAADSSLQKRTIGCDPALSVIPPVTYTTLDRLSALGDLDGDGCDEVGYRYSSGGRGGYAVVFGFDASGARCKGKKAATTVRISGDLEKGLPFFNLGQAAVNAGRLLGGAKTYLAITAASFPVNGRSQPAVLLLDAAQVVAKRPAAGEALVGIIGDGLDVVPLVHDRLLSFGAALIGGVDLTGDATPELIVSAPDATWASEAGGLVLVFEGGATPELLLAIAGDASERSAFGQSLALAPGAKGQPSTLVIGAPFSNRTGTANGTAFTLPLTF
jgi:hypothetical protein